jgi:antitoxin (DNA-binding transcriptional repressor) of toxin-antitoxin stability system
MKTITIELDQFRDRLDQALAEVEQGALILTRQGKPWIVMRAVTHNRDAEILSEAESRGETVSPPPSPHGESVSIIGKTVSWVRNYLGDVFDIPTEAKALVDGRKVSEDWVLDLGQILEFTDEDGNEDWTDELYKSPEFWAMIRERRREDGIPWDEAMRRLDHD